MYSLGRFLATSSFILILISSFLLGVGLVKAQAPVPPPGDIPCESEANPEFHSDRPYQKSPCTSGKDNLALFCGNELAITDSVTGSVANFTSAPNCFRLPDSGYRCTFSVSAAKSYAIDLSESTLPILGNTENVKNSQSSEDEFDDAEKVNEYVSWYLGGTPYKAESGEIDDETIINYSGPIRKLLPQIAIFKAQRESVEAQGETQHDQIVVCAQGDSPKDCYQGSGSPAQDELRLSDWQGDLNPIRNLVNLFTRLLPSFPGLIIDTGNLDSYNKKVPPLPEDDKKYEDPVLYQKAYEEWRGKACIILKSPIGGLKKLLCIDDLTTDEKWAKLFAYIPLTSKEDKLGEVKVDQNAISSGPDVVVSNLNVTSSPADLYFSHAEEVKDLSSILESSYLPEGLENTSEDGINFAPACNRANVRSNPGDSLFAGEINVSVSYLAEFTCDFADTGSPGGLCTKNVGVKLKTITASPEVNDIWTKLVDGSASVFRRIFPKVEPGSPVTSILDIPGSTEVKFTGSVSESGDLYFAHLGGLSEYFLKGIQTALRPKGYGDAILSGHIDEEEIDSKSIINCSDDKEGKSLELPGGSCKIKKASSSWGTIPNLPPTLVKILEAAGGEYGVPPSLLLAIMFTEGAFEAYKGWDWTEGNVANWASCGVMPNCDPNSNFGQGPFSFVGSTWQVYKDAVKAIDPKRVPNKCNLTDQAFAAAKKLQKEHTGAAYPPPASCFGIPLNTGSGGSSTCSGWDNSDVQTGLRQYAGGCLSTSGSGYQGDGIGYCPNDNCEKYQACFGGAYCDSHSYWAFSVYEWYK